MGSAFTTTSNTLKKVLINDVTIEYNENSIQAKALWDTGASISCISYDIVKKLNLIPTGKINMSSTSGESEQSTYLVDIVLPNNVVIKDLVVSDSAIGSQNIGMLIGMDIITRGDFAVSNYNNQTLFTFRIPSEKNTDYVKEMKLSKVMGPKHGQGKRKKKKK